MQLPFQELELSAQDLIPWGDRQAKIRWNAFQNRPARGQLIMVSAMSPSPAGEGKTTVAIGLVDALRRQGKRAVAALRQPSMGPVFGMKGGGTGGGQAKLVPDTSINLHFTGDLHAITSAHNLLSAVLDNHLQRVSLKLDPRRVSWPRVLDMNDRALRNCVVGLGGPSHGMPRQDRFDITAASEIMAILALSNHWEHLRQRLSQIVVGTTREGEAVQAHQLGVAGAMAALLRDALLPNLVQTLEGSPALVHCGPFANIAHGTSSLVATRVGLSGSDFVVQEAGFGADLGGEKFLNIYARQLGQSPALAVVVATLRGIKYHGGVASAQLHQLDSAALQRGLANPLNHLRRLQRFGIPSVVALNARAGESAEEHKLVLDFLRQHECTAFLVDVFQHGGGGALELADYVAQFRQPAALLPSYSLIESVEDKIGKIAIGVYGADRVEYSAEAVDQMAAIEKLGMGNAYICIAKTQYSLSDDPRQVGVAENFALRIRQVKLAAGAGMIVPIAGEIQTMPGLPAHPNAQHIDLTSDGTIVGLS
ncbi:formate--tetrahydrofolate ligase [bacterium]|nr:formate--tetrahydrofolate ligase [bacterium]